LAREKAVEHYDVVIIGAGPAGLTAAIYAGRARLNTLLIEKSLVGGLATYTNEIENYPGFPEKPKGEEITNLMKKQAQNLGVKFKGVLVQSVDLEGEEKVVETFRNKFIAKSVIILPAAVHVRPAEEMKKTICMTKASPSAPLATRLPTKASTWSS
jgi:thioredoxin reductase (NADPH)